jgi:hypothetical protein
MWMVLVALGWMYVVLLMALTEAFAPNGTVLGAIFTFLLYGLLPLSVLLYIMGTPLRRRRAQRLQAEADAASSAAQHDGSGHAAGDAVAAERKEV